MNPNKTATKEEPKIHRINAYNFYCSNVDVNMFSPQYLSTNYDCVLIILHDAFLIIKLHTHKGEIKYVYYIYIIFYSF